MRLCCLFCNWINDRFLSIFNVDLFRFKCWNKFHIKLGDVFLWIRELQTGWTVWSSSCQHLMGNEWKIRMKVTPFVYFFFFFFFVYFLLAPRLLLFCFITTAASALCFRYFVAFAPCYTVHGAWKMVPSRNHNNKKPSRKKIRWRQTDVRESRSRDETSGKLWPLSLSLSAKNKKPKTKKVNFFSCGFFRSNVSFLDPPSALSQNKK